MALRDDEVRKVGMPDEDKLAKSHISHFIQRSEWERNRADRVQALSLSHKTVEALDRKGVALTEAGVRIEIVGSGGVQKRAPSPYMQQAANPVRPGSPPAAPSLTATSGARVGNFDAAPGPAVDDLRRVVLHRHEGTAEGRTPYVHAHEHDEPVSADPTRAGVVDYDTASHLSDPRHRAALQRFEVKGASIDAQIRGLEEDIADSAKMVGSRDYAMRQFGRDRIQKAGELIGQLVDLRDKAAQPSVTKRARPTTDVGKLVAAELNKSLRAQLEKLSLEHPDERMRSGARGALMHMDLWSKR